jgi:hypothetical protein
VKVTVKAGRLKQVREISTSHGHAGLSDEQVLHFGLGKAQKASSIEVRWNTGTAVYKNIPADRYIMVTEGAGFKNWPLAPQPENTPASPVR